LLTALECAASTMCMKPVAAAAAAVVVCIVAAGCSWPTPGTAGSACPSRINYAHNMIGCCAVCIVAMICSWPHLVLLAVPVLAVDSSTTHIPQ
jgi:hypothetical protein